MDVFWSEITAGLQGGEHAARVLIRLVAAMVLGGLIGLQREHHNKPAGLRTHILVSMGSALFVIACTAAEMGADPISRVIQGIATGIGFIGTGAILKRREEFEIHGLTTAAGLWMTAAVGVTAGLGRVGFAAVGVVLTLIVLSVLHYFEIKAGLSGPPKADGSRPAQKV
jgi:putative Mg2+ transporter-C (MgtC) family protein